MSHYLLVILTLNCNLINKKGFQQFYFFKTHIELLKLYAKPMTNEDLKELLQLAYERERQSGIQKRMI